MLCRDLARLIFYIGNVSGFDTCTGMQIPSDQVVFNEKPAMKAREITDTGKAALASGKYDMVRVNYANPDMVGHTGDLKATMQARSFLLQDCGFRACLFMWSLLLVPRMHRTSFALLVLYFSLHAHSGACDLPDMFQLCQLLAA